MKLDMIKCILKQIWVDVKDCGIMLVVVFLIPTILVGMVYIIDWVSIHMWGRVVPVGWWFIAFVIGIFCTLVIVYLYDKYDKCQYKY